MVGVSLKPFHQRPPGPRSLRCAGHTTDGSPIAADSILPAFGASDAADYGAHLDELVTVNASPEDGQYPRAPARKAAKI